METLKIKRAGMSKCSKLLMLQLLWLSLRAHLIFRKIFDFFFEFFLVPENVLAAVDDQHTLNTHI